MTTNPDFDHSLRQEAIDFFVSLINKRRAEGRDTRPIKFAGNVGRHMDPVLKKWFVSRYPNECDYVLFFQKNNKVFKYDRMTGEVDVRRPVLPVVKPERLTQILDICLDPTVDLKTCSIVVSELELLIVLFKLSENGFQLKTSQLCRDFCDPKYKNLWRQLSLLIANPSVETLKFETQLMSYLRDHYKTLFCVDTERQVVSLLPNVMESLPEVTELLDDTIYDTFEALVVKLVRLKTVIGPVDVWDVYHSIESRHPFITRHIFAQNANDYTFIDFCRSKPNVLSIGFQQMDGQNHTIIQLKRNPIEVKTPEVKAPEVQTIDVKTSEVKVKEVETTGVNSTSSANSSGDEIYYSDED